MIILSATGEERRIFKSVNANRKSQWQSYTKAEKKVLFFVLLERSKFKLLQSTNNERNFTKNNKDI